MIGSVSIAEELTQDVFLLLLAERTGYSARRGDLAPYLFGIARNLVRQTLRTRRAEPLDAAASVPADSPDPVQCLTQRQEISAVRKAVAVLPPLYREVVVLCDLGDASYEEAARRLRCPLGTVRSRLHRAHSLLQKKLCSATDSSSLGQAEGCFV